MAHDERIDELVEEILESDRAPEEICAHDPELLAAVVARLRKLRAIEAQFDSLFPASQARARTVYNARASAGGALPTIPDYEVQAILGRGGMGIVYKARHLKLNREVALKMLLSGSYASQQEQQRFMREAESVAALRHPHIVQVYEFGEVDGHAYYTMEYVGGGSLAEKLSGKVQPAVECGRMACALAHAVQAAHAAGIVHRDLKPANILLADGAPKISDFGLARRLDQDSNLTNTGVRIGTPSYMAPEQMAGHAAALGPGVDVFALGAILYEMLTGHPPFRGDSLSDTERKLTTEEPAPPSRFNPKVPRDLETICLKCLEKEPRSRYASAGDLAEELERFLRHEPILARPIPPGERLARWVRRNPLLSALAVTSVVIVALIASTVGQEWSETVAANNEKARLTSRFESGVQLVQAGRFAEARAILGKLGDGGFEDLRQRINRVLRDLDLVEDLDKIGVKRAMALSTRDATWRPNDLAAKGYEDRFVSARIGKIGDDPATVARRIGASEIKQPLIAALDDWAVCESDEARRNWVLDVAGRAGTDAGEWERQCRDRSTWADRETLARLVDATAVAKPSVPQLRALGDRLAMADLDALSFRRRVQEEHVDNFLANLTLADVLSPTDPAEAVRYYQAALAIRPQSATAHNNLAVALAHLNRSAEAMAEYDRSIKLDPSAAAHYNLGLELSKERPGEAIDHLQRAIGLNAQFAAAHRALSELYVRQNRYADAAEALRRCLPLVEDEDGRGQIVELIRSCERQLSPDTKP